MEYGLFIPRFFVHFSLEAKEEALRMHLGLVLAVEEELLMLLLKMRSKLLTEKYI
jgi:hypothetical protein